MKIDASFETRKRIGKVTTLEGDVTITHSKDNASTTLTITQQLGKAWGNELREIQLFIKTEDIPELIAELKGTHR